MFWSLKKENKSRCKVRKRNSQASQTKEAWNKQISSVIHFWKKNQNSKINALSKCLLIWVVIQIWLVVWTLQTCQRKICKSERLWIFLFKKPRDFSLNREILKSWKNCDLRYLRNIVQSVSRHFWFIWYFIPAYVLLKTYWFIRVFGITRIWCFKENDVYFCKHACSKTPLWWKQLILKKD